MFGFTRYNYERFRREMLQSNPTDRWSRAPEPGDEAPNFELRSLAGDLVKLSDFKNSRNVLITFGSATCPQTAASIGGLRALAQEFPVSEVEFLFIYVREAHPGARTAAASLHGRQGPGGHAAARTGADQLPRAGRRTWRRGSSPLRRSAQRQLPDRQKWTHCLSLAGQPQWLAGRRPSKNCWSVRRNTACDHAVVHGGEDAITPSLKTFLNAYRAIERGGYDAVVNFRGELGIPGRVVLRGGRMVRPMTEHPAITITTAAGVLAAIGLGLWAGYELRKRRFAQRPYNAYRKFERRRSDEDDYSAVGI